MVGSRASARQQLQQHHPEREHVPLLRRLRTGLPRFRRAVPAAETVRTRARRQCRWLDVRDGAAEEPAGATRGGRPVGGAAGDCEQVSEAEVGDARGEVGLEEDVGWLDLAVDEPPRAALVEVRQPARRAPGDLQPR